MAEEARFERNEEPVEAEGAAVAEPPSVLRRLLAEFVGTLVFVGVGTGAATALLVGPRQALGGLSEILGPDPAQQQLFGTLLGNNLGDLLAVALAFAFALSFLVYAFGGVSGAHFNPAVTFALAVARRFSWKHVPLYWVVQILGGIAGAFVVAGIYGQGDSGRGAEVLFGGTVIAETVNLPQALLAEAFIGFILVTAIMAIAVDPRAPKGWSGLIIGLALGAGIIVTGPATGGSANFARSLGPFVAAVTFGAPEIPWRDLLIYAAGPLLGGAAAALVYESVTGLDEFTPAPQPGAATKMVGAEQVSAMEVHDHAPDVSHPHEHGGELHSHPHGHERGPDHDHDH